MSKVFEYVDLKEDITKILSNVVKCSMSYFINIDKLKYYVKELDLDILLRIKFIKNNLQDIFKLRSYNNNKSKKLDVLFHKYNNNFLNLLILIYTEYKDLSDDFYCIIKILYDRMSKNNCVYYEEILPCFDNKIYKLIGNDIDFQNYIKNNKEHLYNILFTDQKLYNFYIFDSLIKEYDKEFIDNNICDLLIFYDYDLLYSKKNITAGFIYLIKNNKLTVTTRLLKLLIAGKFNGIYRNLYSVISYEMKCNCLIYYCSNLSRSNGLSNSIVKKIKTIINDLLVGDKLPDNIRESNILFILTKQCATNCSNKILNILEVFKLLVKHGVNINYIFNNMVLDDYIFNCDNDIKFYLSSVYILKFILDYYKNT